MSICKNHVFSLGIAAILACAIPTFAQGLNNVVHPEGQLGGAEADPVEVVSNRYRVGIDCAPAPEALRVHLRLHEASGLLIESVLDDSPAGRAGVKRFDVIVEANGQPVGTVADLIQAVNTAKDTEMNLSLIREGEEKLVKVTPEERDEEEIQRLRNGFANRMGQGVWPDFGPNQAPLDRAMQQQRQFGPLDNGLLWQWFRPGIVLDDLGSGQSSSSTSVIMQNGQRLSIKIERNGDDPANITVHRGNDKWEVTEDHIDQLPDDIRAMVENNLNGARTNIQGLVRPDAMGIPRNSWRPNAQRPAVPPRPDRRSDDQMQERFDGLELRIEELQNLIENIREQ